MMWASRFVPRFAPLRSVVAVCVVAASASSANVLAQPPETGGLKMEVERRYEVLPLRDGIALRPRSSSPIRAIDISGGSVALDGQPVTGAELRTRLGSDADLILQLSYLGETQRRALFEPLAADRTAAPPVGALPAPSAAPEPPRASEPPPPPTPPERSRPRRAERDRGDRVRFGGSVDVEEDESIEGDVVVIGGSARVDGEVLGEVVVVGGSLRLGPKAEVQKDVVVVGGSLDRDPGATIGGKVEQVSIGSFDFGKWRAGRSREGGWWRGAFGPTFSVVSTLVRVGVLCLLVALVMLFAREYVDKVSARAVSEPVKAGAIGLLAQALVVPLVIITTVVLIVTIVGIPLLALIPFALLALSLFALAGFSAVASLAGGWLTRRFGWTEYGPITTTVLGVAVLAAPVVLARLVGLVGGPLWVLSIGLLIAGFVTEYVAWTIGMGAVALSRFSPDRPAPRGSVLGTDAPLG